MPLRAFWNGRNVLLTGHTGFKGAWLALWLKHLGARVTGLSLPAHGGPSLYGLLGPELVAREHLLDIRDGRNVRAAVMETRPEIVLHLAGQSLVRKSFREPLETFATNVMGTLNLLEGVDKAASAAVVLVVTSDKVYRNRDDGHAFREDDPLGGDDPYSASKSAVEIAAAGWRNSYWRAAGPVLATARAGNVIGGGDWTEDRLIPDYIRAVASEKPFILHNPGAVRPWQHVLDVSYGYLLYARRLAENRNMTRTLNLSPPPDSGITTQRVIEALSHHLPHAAAINTPLHPALPEKQHLTLDPELARMVLGWRARLTVHEALQWTGKWYAQWLRHHDMKAYSAEQLGHYEALISD